MENETKRSKLNTFEVIKWLNTRFDNRNRQNAHYLFSPEELIREREIERIFTEFDADGSGGLSRSEVYNMFQGFDIDMPLQKLNELYDSVEKNLEELDLAKFKQCALSDRSNKVFTGIVLSMNHEGYMPTKFTEMITYLVYLSKREELVKRIRDQKATGLARVESMGSLLKLRELAENNKEVNSKLAKIKGSLNGRFRKVFLEASQNLKMSNIKMDSTLLNEVREAYEKHKTAPEKLDPISPSRHFIRESIRKYRHLNH